MALPMKPEAAPLSALGHFTTCNLPTMDTHTHTHIHTHTHTHTHIPTTFFRLFNVHYSMLKLLRHNEISRNKGKTLSNLKRKGKGRRDEGARRDVSARGWMCVWGAVDLIVCVCVCVRACFFPFHTIKGALMLYTLYVEPTVCHLQAPMKRALVTRSKPNTLNIWPKSNTLISSFNFFYGGLGGLP